MKTGRMRARNDVGQKQGKTHNSEERAHGGGGQVAAELGADNTAVSVGAGDPAPDNAVLGAVNLTEGLVNVCHTLSEVEAGVMGGLDLLQPQQGGVSPLGALSTLETEEAGANVKPFW